MSIAIPPFVGVNNNLKVTRLWPYSVNHDNFSETYTKTFSKGGYLIITSETGFVYYPYKKLHDSNISYDPALSRSMYVSALTVDDYWIAANAGVLYMFANNTQFDINATTYDTTNNQRIAIGSYIIPVANTIELSFTTPLRFLDYANMTSAAFFFTELEYV